MAAIGVIMSNLANPFFQDIVREIESEVRKSGQGWPNGTPSTRAVAVLLRKRS